MATKTMKTARRSSDKRHSARQREKERSKGVSAGQPDQAPKSAESKLGIDAMEALRKFFGTSSRVVQQVASILEEKIAVGIVAAKQIEEKFMNTAELRAGKPDELFPRLRRDWHEAGNIFLDLLSAITKYSTELTRSAKREGPPTRSSGGQVPTLMMPEPVKPGKSATVTMTLENESDKPTGSLVFHCTDLVSIAGDRIPAQRVTFKPNSLVIGSRQKATADITVSVPKSTHPSIYSGLIIVTRLNQLRAMLTVQVV